MQERGMVIEDEKKAKEELLDIGYYRLGYYWFPFEETYPCLDNRTHKFRVGTNFNDAVKLYYFDFDLRNLLLKYISRIEIKFKTMLTYIVSNEYQDSPTWFVDPSVVVSNFIESFDDNIYTKKLKSKSPIARHHKKYPEDKYAPVWKVIEYMSLGATITLYRALRSPEMQKQVANEMGLKYSNVFMNYITVVRDLRNCSAHGNAIFDYRPSNSIRRGPAIIPSSDGKQNLFGALQVISYLLGSVSKKRQGDLRKEVLGLINKYGTTTEVRRILDEESGLGHWKA